MHKLLLSIAVSLLVIPAYAGTITRPYTFTNGTVIDADQVNLNETTIYSEFNGGIDTANLEDGGVATADIADSAVTNAKLESVVRSSFTYLLQLATYRKPNLVFQSTTLVDVENNTGTANETCIMFPNERRCVTEDLSSTNKYRRFDITAAAQFLTGTEDSGLIGATEANNTWYAIYAVKSQVNSANFVLVGSTRTPTQANYSTLNTMFGTNSWVYLGSIRNGDNNDVAGDILAFRQTGAMVVLRNTINTGVDGTGVMLSSGTTVGTITWAAATGTSGQVVSDVVGLGYVWAEASARDAGFFGVYNSAGAKAYVQWRGGAIASHGHAWAPTSDGFLATNNASVTTDTYYLGIKGWTDIYLNGVISSGF